VDVETAYGSLIAAPEGAAVGRAQWAMFINAAVAGSDDSSRPLKVTDLPLEPLPVHPLAGRLKVLGLFRTEGTSLLFREFAPGFGPPPSLGIVFRLDDRRYVAEIGKPIVDQDGARVEQLRDWQVGFANDRLALFSSATTDVPVRLEGR
jgi:hypothetical protein